MFHPGNVWDMPALLSDAYGDIFSQAMQNTVPKLKNPQNPKKTKRLQDTNEKPRALGTKAAVVNTRPLRTEKRDGNYEIHITIDRHDCHLLCLFIGVFTLSVLFNRNKRGSTFTSG